MAQPQADQHAPTPPQNQEAEESVLGAMLLSPAAIDAVSDVINAADFYRASHARIYRAAATLHALGQPVDEITVADRLAETGHLHEAGGKTRIHELAALVPAASNARHYARIVAKLARRRALARLGEQIARIGLEGLDGADDPEQLDTHALQLLEEHVHGRPATTRPTIQTADVFLDAEEEIATPAIGEPGETLLPLGGLLIMAGEGGASKTTLTLDAVAHAASGTPWLGFPVPRPLRVLVIENEGPRPQFREKLAAKAASWEGEPWRDNVHIWANPWAGFSFADPSDRRALTDAARDLHLDLVVGDPLDSLGIMGAGSPEDVREFIGYLKTCGLHNPDRPLAFWLLHHYSKAAGKSVVQSLSGAWGGHPDAVIGVELGDGQTTKITWGKLRHATPPKNKTTILSWDITTRGFTPIDLPTKATDEELDARIIEYLRTVPEGEIVSTSKLVRGVKGTDAEIARRAAFLASVSGGHLLSNPRGPRAQGTYWKLSDRAEKPPRAGVTQGYAGVDDGQQLEWAENGHSTPARRGHAGVAEVPENGAERPGEDDLCVPPSIPPVRGGGGGGDAGVEPSVTNPRVTDLDDDEIERLRALAETDPPAEEIEWR